MNRGTFANKHIFEMRKEKRSEAKKTSKLIPYVYEGNGEMHVTKKICTNFTYINVYNSFIPSNNNSERQTERDREQMSKKTLYSISFSLYNRNMESCSWFYICVFVIVCAWAVWLHSKKHKKNYVWGTGETKTAKEHMYVYTYGARRLLMMTTTRKWMPEPQNELLPIVDSATNCYNLNQFVLDVYVHIM